MNREHLQRLASEEWRKTLEEFVLPFTHPGALFFAMDGVAGAGFEAMHTDDVYNPVDPDALAQRLSRLGFMDVALRSNALSWACHARRPA